VGSILSGRLRRGLTRTCTKVPCVSAGYWAAVTVSAQARLHANAGKHKELPRAEAESAVRFFARHFGRTVTAPT
jgi:hypothetical protein